MADITWAVARDGWRNKVRLLDELEQKFASSSPNVHDLEATIVAGVGGDAAERVLSKVGGVRSKLASIISPEGVRDFLTPDFENIMQALDMDVRSFPENALAFRDWMEDEGETVLEETITYDTPGAGGSNAGTGVVYEILQDEFGTGAQGLTMEPFALVCVSDQGQVDKHSEVFEYLGTTKAKDWLKVVGSGRGPKITSLSVVEARRFLRNPSFEGYIGTAPAASSPSTPSALTDVTGWVLDTAANYRVTLDTIFRGGQGIVTPYALSMLASGTFYQLLSSNVAPRMREEVPLIVAPALHSAGTPDGELTLSIGAVDNTFNANTLSAGWNRKVIATNSNAYYDSWNEDLARIQNTWSSRTQGTITFDDYAVGFPTLIDGRWFAVIGGATPWKRKDRFDAEHTKSGRAKMQYWTSFRTQLSTVLRRLFSLRSTASGYHTISEPS